MKKITFEEYLKLPKEERAKIINQSTSLNEDERVEVDNPISNMTFDEAMEYLRSIGCVPLEEVEEKINSKFDKYAVGRKPSSEETENEQ